MPGFGFAIDQEGRIRPLPEAGRANPVALPWESLDIALEDGRLFFYGGLHGRRALARTLDLNPDAATGALLAAAIRHWPADWSQRLSGHWVCARWSATQRRLELWREASGLLSLYWAHAPGGERLVATDLDRLAHALRCAPGGAGLHEYLHLLDIAPPHTIYPRIQAVGAGEGLTWSGPDHTDATPVAPAREPGPAQALDEAEAVEALETRLLAALATQLEGARRPAAFLSSGVDSTLLCALAARLRPDLSVITVGFEPAELDEAARAAAIARHLRLRHEVWRYDQPALTKSFAAWVAAAPQPMADPAILPSVLAFRQAHERFDVVLDGTGADELMGAMPPRHLRVAVEWASRLPRPLRRLAATVAQALPGGHAPVFAFDHPAEVLRRWKGFTASEIAAGCRQPVDLEQTAFYRTFARHPRAAHFERYSALLAAMPCDRLGQAACATGLDVRFPYWAPPVAAWLRALPMAWRWQADSPKHLLRRLLARHVPRALWEGPKRGFDFPLQRFLAAEDFKMVRRYLLAANGSLRQIFAQAEIDRYARRYLAGEKALSFRIWALVVLSAWLDAHAHAVEHVQASA